MIDGVNMVAKASKMSIYEWKMPVYNWKSRGSWSILESRDQVNP